MNARWQRAAALVALAVVGAVGWRLWMQVETAPQAGPAPTPTAITHGSPSAAPVPPTATLADPAPAKKPALAPMPVAVAVAKVARPVAPAAAASAAQAWDICGIGTLPLPPAHAGSSPADVQPPLHLFPEAELRAARQRVLDAMDSGDPFARATALLLRAVDDRGGTRESITERLNTLALTSGDPAALTLAALRCGSGCGTALSDAWVRADPTNAAAWLSLMQQQPRRRDEALAALAQVQQYRLRWGGMAGALLNAMPPDVPPLAQLVLLIDATGIDAATSLPPMQPVVALCKPAPDMDAATTAACAALARAMAERSDTVLGTRIGLRLATSVGWPQAQVDAMRTELDQLQRSQHAVLDAAQPLSCASLNAARDWAAAVARHGELGALAARSPRAASAAQQGR